MSLLNKLGKKHIELATQWVGSALVYGAAAGAGLCYFTDWKVVVTYLPYYNIKFRNTEEEQ